MVRQCFDESIDPIEHLAKALYFDAWQGRGFVVATTVYADASGQLNTEPCYLIGGWWNSVTNWMDFDKEWKAFLRRHCICYLHQTGSRKKTDYWKKDRVLRDQINIEAVDIIRRSGAVSFVHFTPDDDYRRFVSELPAELQDLDAFVYNAFRFVLDVRGWCKKRHLSMPEFVFEEMDNVQHRIGLEKVMRDYDLPLPIFREKNAKDRTRSIVALQAADFIAYEVFRGWRDLMNKGHSSRSNIAAFERIEHQWSWADYQKLKALVPISQVRMHLERISKGQPSTLDWGAWWARDYDSSSPTERPADPP
jgi:hypothetical protein